MTHMLTTEQIELRAAREAEQMAARAAMDAECAAAGGHRYADRRCIYCFRREPTAPVYDPGQIERAETAATGCTLYTAEQGCPLHGETCAH